MARRKAPYIPDLVLDQFLTGADPRAALEPNDLLDRLKEALTERVLNARWTTIWPVSRATAATATAPSRC